MFDSTPPGATVSLIIDGKRQVLGPAPARSPLDPRLAYRVAFERPGYVSVNRPIAFSGALEEKVQVELEKRSGGRVFRFDGRVSDVWRFARESNGTPRRFAR